MIVERLVSKPMRIRRLSQMRWPPSTGRFAISLKSQIAIFTGQIAV
jgi:hypothetical protein